MKSIAGDMVDAVRDEDKDALYDAVTRLWEGPEAPYPPDSNLADDDMCSHRIKAFNRIFDSKLRLHSDGGEGEAIEMAQQYYRAHPELFGFKDKEEYEYISWVFGDIDTDICESVCDYEELKDSPIGIFISGNFFVRLEFPDGKVEYQTPEHAYKFIELERSKFVSQKECMREYESLLWGLPREEDKLKIINWYYPAGQSCREGAKLNKRLILVLKKEKQRAANEKRIANEKAMQSIRD